MALNWRNPMRSPDGTITVEIEHRDFGWIPYNAVADDPHDVLLRDGNRKSLHRVILDAELAGEVTVADAAAPAVDPYPPLDARQFRWMLAYYDLEAIWQGVHADAKAAGNRALAANLRANEDADTYYIENTLALMAQVRDQPKVANSGVDLSDDAIRRYWRHAAVQTFESLTEVVPPPE